MEDIKVLGKQNFNGVEIPVVAGGFGPDKNASVIKQSERYIMCHQEK